MNPSPRQIFEKIARHTERKGQLLPETMNACERKTFSEFMCFILIWQNSKWDSPIPDEAMKVIKRDNPDWYRWGVDQGLIKRKMVKKEVSGIITWRENEGFIYPYEHGCNIPFQFWKGLTGKLTFEWEEEEK
jgi:hypothetical protein